jgi:hypothetical protein
MRIGLMSLWNAASGASIHAELVGREWVRAGHKLTVYSALRHPDARPTGQLDEPYVVRHFSVEAVKPVVRASYFDPNPLLEGDYEVFVAENVERLPTRKLLTLFPRIKVRAATVMVVHEGGPPQDPYFYRFDWDAVVCFDERYRRFLTKHFPEERVHIIPYPCHPFRPGNREEARRRLSLPLEGKIVLSYGFRPSEAVPILPTLAELAQRFRLHYLIVVNPAAYSSQLLQALTRYPFVEVRVEALSLPRLYDYLYASDALLIHREYVPPCPAILSSTVCLALGAGTPIIHRDSRFVELHEEEVLKYRNREELKGQLTRVLEGRFDLEPVLAYLRERSADVVAARFIRLFESLLDARGELVWSGLPKRSKGWVAAVT